jgi:hypothetical protein
MAYRRVFVKDKPYEYVLGRSNIHIKGLGDFSVKAHGNPVCIPRDEDDLEGHDTGHRVASIRTVKAIILGQQTPVLYGDSPKVMLNPFDSEIHGKQNYLPYNPKAYYSLKHDI